MTLISIIIPVYNGEKYIEKALNSVFMQTLPREKYEIIVSNDGSTDGTLSILNKYKDKIKILYQQNKGLVHSCNRAICESKGKYIIRLDADDYFDKELLSKSLEILENNPKYHCIYTDLYEIDVLKNTKFRVNIGKNDVFSMVACGILFRRCVFDELRLYRNLLFEEYDLMIRFFNKGFIAYYLQEPLYYYVRHNLSMTTQKNYWLDGWNELLKFWGLEELRKWVHVQLKEKGTSRFSCFLNEVAQ